MKTASLIFLVLFAGAAMAEPGGPRWQVAFDYGNSASHADSRRTDFDVYRIGLRKDFNRVFWSGSRARFTGYWEASLNYWDAENENVYAAALSPVFVLYFLPGSDRIQPYLEAGIGAALISDHSFAGREMSTAFQFEDRIGVGIRTRNWDVHYRFMHYSNGGIEKPNNGFDAHVVGLTYIF